jgi:hypothetical protein
MIFLFPSMVALAAMALSSILQKVRHGWGRYVVLGIIVAGLAHPLRHIIRNHPNTYIYFNEWSGGINNTYGRYETDFYTNSLRPASDYFIDEILPGIEPDSGTIRIVSNFNVGYYFRDHREVVTTFYSRYHDREREDWDYAILYCNYIHPFMLNNGFWPPKNTIREIRVDDVVVAAIVERKNRDAFLGNTLMEQAGMEQNADKMSMAIEYLESAIAYDSANIAASLDLGNAYISFLRFDDARKAMDRVMRVYPSYDKALNIKGYSYMVEAEVSGDLSLIDQGIRLINQAVKTNYKFYSGYFNLGLAYGMKDDMNNAEYYFKLAIRYNSKFKQAYDKLAEVYDIQGLADQANRVRELASRLP